MTPPNDPESATPRVPKARSGPLHLLDATRYSVAGFRRLLREPAARQELALGGIGLAVIILAGGSAGHVIGFLVLVAALLAAEALNTAIEVLADHLSPDWSQMAKDAKDLGSLAVGLLVLANLAFVGAVAFGMI